MFDPLSILLPVFSTFLDSLPPGCVSELCKIIIKIIISHFCISCFHFSNIEYIQTFFNNDFDIKSLSFIRRPQTL